MKKFGWGGQGIFCHGRSNSKGVATPFPKNSDISVTKTIKDPDGCFLILQVTKNKEHLTLFNVYAPTSNEPNNQSILIGKIYKNLADLEIHNLFIGGDFNVKLDDPTNASTTARDSYVNQIRVFLDDSTLVDVWKKKNPRGTFHRHTYSARLGYLFEPEYLLPSVSSIQILPEPLLRPLCCHYGC